MKNHGSLKFFIGIEVSRSKLGIFLNKSMCWIYWKNWDDNMKTNKFSN